MPDPHQADSTTEADVDASRRGFMHSALLVAGAAQLPWPTPYLRRRRRRQPWSRLGR